MANIPTSLTSTPAAPATDADRVAWLRLLRSRRVGPTTFHRLMQEHGSAQAALDALPDIAAAAGVSKYQACPEGVAWAELRAASKAGAWMLPIGSDGYPRHLAELLDAPPFLWCVGDAQVLTRPMIALVGARNASSLGTRMARTLATGLAEAGFVTVSGLARGIDTVTHVATQETGTIAVMPGGVDIRYPPENAQLAHDIAQNGLLVSEQPMGLAPIARHFPKRNRIISGLARAVIVVEAASRSGSLITARNALDQGRDVLAVPGHPFDARAGGCNMLLRDGAVLIRSVADVIEALGPQEAPTPVEQPQKRPTHSPDTARLHQMILDRLGPSPMAEDQLVRDLHVRAPDLGPALTELELQGSIERHPGGLLARRDLA